MAVAIKGGNHGGVLVTEQQAYLMSQKTKELTELRQLLGRTHHVPPDDIIRCGTHATLSLRKLNDGQSDDIATLRSRRVAEEERAAQESKRPGWDGSVWMYVPPALKGCKPITPEPWARDASAYEDGMTHGHGHKRAVVDSRYIEVSAELAKNPPKHVNTIENAMRAYRKEVGTSGVVSPRAGPSPRAIKAAASPMSTPPSSPPPTSTRRSARLGKTDVEQAATDRAARIKARSEAKSSVSPKGKLAPKAAKGSSPTSVIG